MSLLSYNELVRLVEQGVITNIHDEDYINSSSIDITLGDTILIEEEWPKSDVVSLKGRDKLDMKKFTLTDENYFILKPGQFILASSEQVFHLPQDISAEYKLKSSMARIGLENLNAGHCDAGWNNSVLTLELKNMTQHHNIMLHKGVRIGQMLFHQHRPVPDGKCYGSRGRYNNDQTVQGIKP